MRSELTHQQTQSKLGAITQMEEEEVINSQAVLMRIFVILGICGPCIPCWMRSQSFNMNWIYDLLRAKDSSPKTRMATAAEKNAPQRKQRLVKNIATFVLIAAIVGPGIYGFGSAASTATPSGSNPSTNPTPTITTISPNSAVASGAAFILTIIEIGDKKCDYCEGFVYSYLA